MAELQITREKSGLVKIELFDAANDAVKIAAKADTLGTALILVGRKCIEKGVDFED